MHRENWKNLLAIVPAFLILVSQAPAEAKPGKKISITATPIEHFLPEKPGQRIFGKLEFLGGLELDSDRKNFGGISGFRFVDPDGAFLSITDQGNWLSGKLQRNGSAPNAIANARIGSLRKANGKKLKGKKNADAEGLEIAGNAFLISFERNHRVERFAWQNEKLRQVSGIQTINLNGYNLENNHGPEAIAQSPISGDVYIFPEGDAMNDRLYRGFILQNSDINEIEVVRNGFYRLTDASFASSGELYLLERFYNPIIGVAIRIRRFSQQELSGPDALSGEILLEAGWKHEIDNMEGLDITTMSDGSTRLTVISDDNFSKSQRTLLLEFRLAD